MRLSFDSARGCIQFLKMKILNNYEITFVIVCSVFNFKSENIKYIVNFFNSVPCIQF